MLEIRDLGVIGGRLVEARIPVVYRIGEHSNVDANPSYRLHKGSGQAVVTLNGRDFYLGKFGSLESKDEYDRLIAQWIFAGRRLDHGHDLTVSELIRDYLNFADTYYKKNREKTGEVECLRPQKTEQRRGHRYSDAPSDRPHPSN